MDYNVEYNPFDVDRDIVEPFPDYIVSSKRAVAAYGTNELYLYQEEPDGVTKLQFTPSYPPEYDEDHHIHGAVGVLEFRDQLYCVEHHRGLDDDEDDLRVEDRDEFTVKIHKLEGQIWYEQAVMPLTLGGRCLKVEDSEEVWEYGVGRVAAVSDGICLSLGVRKAAESRKSSMTSFCWEDYEYYNVVLYHPESYCWELVGHHVEHYELFEPRF